MGQDLRPLARSPDLRPTREDSAVPRREDTTVDTTVSGMSSCLSSPLTSQIPRGEYINDGASRRYEISEGELQRLKKLIAKLADSPLGCLDFEKTFTARKAEG